MQCQCGSDTTPGNATTLIKGSGRYTLDFQTCKACQRVGGEILKLDANGSSRAISFGVQARYDYSQIEAGIEPAQPSLLVSRVTEPDEDSICSKQPESPGRPEEQLYLFD